MFAAQMMWAAPKAPSLRGLSAKLTGGVDFLGWDTPSGSSSHLPQRGRQGRTVGGLGVRVFACVFYGKMRINGKERVAIMGFFLYNKLIEFLLFVRELACI